MRNPYFIDEPAVISFSGGRSSAYMLYKIIETHDGVLPDDVIVCFANTGKEMPQTLDFVRDCAENWGVDIVWLEFQGLKKPHKIVDYETASRNSEPFDILIDEKKFLPSQRFRFCTEFLKVLTIISYMGKQEDFVHVVGFRADEPRRVVNKKNHKTYLDKNQDINYLFPLYDAKIIADDIDSFWRKQNFNLDLPMVNGKTDWGNCDLCYLKGGNIKKSIIRAQPYRADWWAGKENLIGARFNNKGPSYEEMSIIVRDQIDIDLGDVTIPCFCGD